MRHENDSTCICTCWAGGSKEKAHHSHLLFLFAIRASICTITAGWVVNRYPCCVWWQLSSHHSWQKDSLAAVLHGAEVSCRSFITFWTKKNSFPVASNSCLLKVINLPSNICRCNGGEVEDEKEIVVGDIATVTVQLMWESPKKKGSDLMGEDLYRNQLM